MITSQTKCLVVGAGVSGLIATKELMEVGIKDILVLEKNEDIGGVWGTYCWNSTTLTSSKWVTEFGSYPMPDNYPDFPTPKQMMEYLQSLALSIGLEKHLRCGVTVKSIQKNSEGKFDVVADDNTRYDNYDFVVICSGLHGTPSMPNFPGLNEFQGEVIHGSEYKSPERFQDKRALCIGLGESGIGINSEISSVASKTIVSSGSFTPAPRVFPYTTTPFDQMQFWPVGEYMKDYQEVLTVGQSWYYRLPQSFKVKFAQSHIFLKAYPKEWLPEAMVPYRWHAKYWPKPGLEFKDFSGNLTRPEAPTDDILHLVNSGQITAKGKVLRFDKSSVYFNDGSKENIDIVIANIGYKPATLKMQLPNNWTYKHQELYKGCFNPDIPNLAFVGMVRPTIGSIPAMAEMQARLVAQVFSGNVQLPSADKLKPLVIKEANQHHCECPTMQERLPHVYFFDKWMEEMAELIGCRPKISNHLNSWKQLQAYLLGAPMPLRFRLHGPGAVEDGYEKYAARVSKVWGNRFGALVRANVITRLIYPYLLTLIIAAISFWGANQSISFSLGISFLFLLAYMKIDLFRFIVTSPFLIGLVNAKPLMMEPPELPPFDRPDYKKPKVFQSVPLETPISELEEP